MATSSLIISICIVLHHFYLALKFEVNLVPFTAGILGISRKSVLFIRGLPFPVPKEPSYYKQTTK